MAVSGELIYDADCGFCTSSARWIAGDADVFPIVPWQSFPDLGALRLTIEDVTTAAYWRAPNGRLWRGSDAIAMALRARGGLLALVGVLILFTPLRPVARLVYRWTAANRYRMPGGTAACRLGDQRPTS